MQLVNRIPCLVGMAFILLMTGCSGAKSLPVAKVKGTLKDHGKPLDGATVTFYSPSGPPAIGKTDSSGAFQLTTYSSNDGATVGDHAVLVAKIGPPAGMTEEEYKKKQESATVSTVLPEPTFFVPAKYSNPAQTPLKATVKAGTQNEINFDLTD